MVGERRGPRGAISWPQALTQPAPSEGDTFRGLLGPRDRPGEVGISAQKQTWAHGSQTLRTSAASGSSFKVPSDSNSVRGQWYCVPTHSASVLWLMHDFSRTSKEENGMCPGPWVGSQKPVTATATAAAAAWGKCQAGCSRSNWP